MPVDRDNFTRTWLQAGTPIAKYANLDHRPLREVDGVRADILVPLTQAIVDHHTHLARIKGWITTLGFIETKAELDRQLKFGHNTRMGNFGEVIASEALVQREGYSMPLFKLRYRDCKLPMRGEDILAFHFDANGVIDLLVVGEAKAYTSYEKQPIKDALKRLQISYNPHPQSLNLIAEILYGAGRDEEAAAIDNLISNLAIGQVNQEHWIVFITGNENSDPFECIDLPSTGPKVICVDLPMADIRTLVETVFTPSVYWEGL